MNSRPVTSNQIGVHEDLCALLERHRRSAYQRPVAEHSLQAFHTSIAAWQSTGLTRLVIDAGCGVGLSTRKLAQIHTDCFVIGIDQSADRLARKVRWEAEAGGHFILVRANLVDFWRLMLDARIHPAFHYLLYPNPWPKKSQLARRWHGHPVFPFLLALGGQIECRSNWKIYIEEFASAATQLTGQPASWEIFEPAPEALTPFEENIAPRGMRSGAAC